MARSARIRSQSGIYHIMLRGINHQQIFEEDNDCIQFLKILFELIPICKFKLYAYCLMGNHVHLLIKEDDETIDMIIKRLNIRFVAWYNRKYERTGHLFENRYRSEPVDEEGYLLTVLRYILQNPVKAGVCQNAFEYPWSSASACLSQTNSFISISDFYHQYFQSTNQFIHYINAQNDDCCLEEMVSRQRVSKNSDDKIRAIIKNKTGCTNISEFQALNSLVRNQFIKELDKSVSVRQLSRLTGLSKSQIQRIKAG